MVNVSLRVAYCLIVAWGIFNICLDLVFAQTAPTVTTGRVASPNETSEPLVGVVYLDETSVSLYGTVNPNGLATTVWFEYGTSSGSYSNTSSTQNVSGTTTQRIRSDIGGLSLSTQADYYYTYYYRIAAQNSAGISYGSEKYIVPIVPNFSSGVATYDATNITSNSAILRGEATTYVHDAWFELDTIDGEYFYEVNATDEKFPSYSTNISGLSPATTYYYRIAGWDKLYIYYGEQKSFKTLEASATPTPTPDLTPISTPAPCDEGIILETYKATDVTLDSATLNGLIGGDFSVRGILGFEYGTTSGSYPNRIGLEGSDSSNVFVEGGYKSYRVNGLSAGTTYYYRIYKYRIEIIPDFTPCYSYGNEEVFTTLTCEAKSASVSPKRLILQRRENSEVTVTLQSDNCVPEGNTVIATIGKVGSRRISISSTSEVTDENGQAKFTITAKDEVGKAKVTFKSGSVKKAIIVKVVRQ